METTSRFSIPTNWDDELINKLSGFPIHEIYGSLSIKSVANSICVSSCHINRLAAVKHLKLIYSKGFKFNCILNSSCLGNRENDPSFRKQVYEYIKFLEGEGVTSVTIANPYLLELVKTKCPEMYVIISAAGEVDGIPKAQFFKSLGADALIVNTVKNRDFRFLSNLRKAVSGDIRLIVNQLGLYQCAYDIYHENCNSHSNPDDGGANDASNYCVLKCTREMLADTQNFLRSRWIRPEDLHVYEKLGYNSFVLYTNGKKTDGIIEIVKAYSNRFYNGNLLQIVNNPNCNQYQKSILRSVANYTDLNMVVINNKELNGFLNYFEHNDCTSACHRCNYCNEFAEKAISANVRLVDDAVIKIEKLIDSYL